MEFIRSHPDDLHIPAHELALRLRQTPMAVFEGGMGAGKTTFIRALCREMGTADEVSSPTFSLVNEYRLPDGSPVFHFDFYRIDSVSEAEDMGIYEYFDGGVCLIEWGEKIAPLLEGEPHILVKISPRGDKRFITFEDSPKKH